MLIVMLIRMRFILNRLSIHLMCVIPRRYQTRCSESLVFLIVF